MGEVGSGKTVVALYAMLRAVEHGLQAALMAPTETLAEQHFATIQALMPGELVRVGLLTGSTPAPRRADLLGKLETGELSLIVGTHALIEDAVRFARLAVVGRRRAAPLRRAPAGGARRQGPRPGREPARPAHDRDADPAHARAGRLRRPRLHACCASCRAAASRSRRSCAPRERERARAYDRIREELRAGRQAFVVCPLVEESEALQARAATAEFERLRDAASCATSASCCCTARCARGEAGGDGAFAAGEADVLVATSVIEVGIDVPNATVMLVEDAERYGISQLHQLRGRIGRGAHASLCLLFGAKDSARLRALAASADGFELAEIDLRLRGEGELIGTRQHGLAQFRVAELPRDAELLERARAHARADRRRRIRRCRAPEHALLADALGRSLRGRGGGADPGVSGCE